MIEKFTKRELAIIKKELAEQEKGGVMPLPTKEFRAEVQDLLSDRPYSEKITESVVRAIDRIAAATLNYIEWFYRDNLSIDIAPFQAFTNEEYDKFYELGEKIISLMRDNLAPYEYLLPPAGKGSYHPNSDLERRWPFSDDVAKKFFSRDPSKDVNEEE